jgi:hypothetical protein
LTLLKLPESLKEFRGHYNQFEKLPLRLGGVSLKTDWREYRRVIKLVRKAILLKWVVMTLEDWYVITVFSPYHPVGQQKIMHLHDAYTTNTDI